MTLRLYTCLPYLLSITDDMDINSNGQANGPLVRIRKGKEGDKGLLAHEEIHVAQWYMTLGLHGLLYRFNLKYRLRSEVEAYRKQLEYNYIGDHAPDYYRNLYATWLSIKEPEGYGLQDIVTKDEALKLLS